MIKTVAEMGKQVDSVPMKTVYINTAANLIQAGMPVVFLNADLMLSLGEVVNWEAYPQHVYNCGIAEANMMGVAAGLSTDGLVPFIHTFAPFASRRMFDQVFVSGAYSQLNVKIMASDPGISMQINGGTHCTFEDVALMRSIPGMTILDATDNVALKKMMYLAANTYGMFYIRFPRIAVENIYAEETELRIGQAATLVKGSDVTILSAGMEVREALKAAALLAQEGISARVIDALTIKPLDEACVLQAAKETGAIVVAENHNVIGGLGSAVAQLLAEKHPTPMAFIGSQDQFGEVGPLEWLRERYGMTAVDIANCAKGLVNRK